MTVEKAVVRRRGSLLRIDASVGAYGIDANVVRLDALGRRRN